MIAIGVTGSLSSGKSTVSKIIGGKKYPIFSADKVVYKLYKNALFVKNLKKQFKIKSSRDIKKSLKKLISLDKKILKKLEKYMMFLLFLFGGAIIYNILIIKKNKRYEKL